MCKLETISGTLMYMEVDWKGEKTRFTLDPWHILVHRDNIFMISLLSQILGEKLWSACLLGFLIPSMVCALARECANTWHVVVCPSRSLLMCLIEAHGDHKRNLSFYATENNTATSIDWYFSHFCAFNVIG